MSQRTIERARNSKYKEGYRFSRKLVESALIAFRIPDHA